MASLEWIKLYEAFELFKAQAERRGLYAAEMERIEDDLFSRCPIPQPKPMRV
ncbi:MAG: hypothetical protein IKH16_07870 [Selenomonadaceae bacterium]|nr:hypothetical protein [Selenomonadaceae bacterium]MBR4695189.1 hypothetical protein [Selenomonadaceae bacterium]